MILSINNLTKTFPTEDKDLVAIQDFSLDIEEGEFVCVLGPSGCGKTTLLRIIAGLESASSGKILFEGRPITGPGSDRGMVFQEFALLPWRNVRRNVEFGLEIKRVPPEERKKTSDRYIELV
ncbi:MAG: ATP-binding cassette domain-containing protein, partial [Methanomassiliicoccales archaeon]|nr:ATP-binding cassette domain-containing protein [Methanomassiliicoccales archaeon]